mmetsp:Transcript_27928/g.78263  ORF Transcript_27928/g.78263 Transcript_27928/m.78263 type:complete len:257 (+) Transcript_27928:642-1412(+)
MARCRWLGRMVAASTPVARTAVVAPVWTAAVITIQLHPRMHPYPQKRRHAENCGEEDANRMVASGVAEPRRAVPMNRLLPILDPNRSHPRRAVAVTTVDAAEQGKGNRHPLIIVINNLRKVPYARHPHQDPCDRHVPHGVSRDRANHLHHHELLHRTGENQDLRQHWHGRHGTNDGIQHHHPYHLKYFRTIWNPLTERNAMTTTMMMMIMTNSCHTTKISRRHCHHRATRRVKISPGTHLSGLRPSILSTHSSPKS